MSPAQWVHLAILLFSCAQAGSARAAETLQAFPNAQLLPDDANDGDSLRVATGSTTLVARLYFVDCPEMRAPYEAMARRIREQTRYFALPEGSNTLAFGRAARDFARAQLRAPFTIHTAFSPVLGSGGERARYYVFITTADGRDLASLLVASGYARAKGTGRPTPEGVTQAEQWDRLRDLEAAAMLKRVGIWAQSDPDCLPASRSMERQETQELQRLVYGGDDVEAATVNLNLGTREELEALPGIGPVMAETIMAGRPYTNRNDLFQARGFGPKLRGQLDSRLVLGHPTDSRP